MQTDMRQEQTLQLLRDKKYDELQARMDGFLTEYLAGHLTDEELSLEFHAFYRWGPSLTPLFQEWVNEFPKSYAANHGMAIHLSSVAWRQRGDRFANETSEEQLRQFDKKIRDSQSWAMRAIGLFKKPILSYELLLDNAIAIPEARPYADRILKDSIRIERDNVIVRYAYVRMLAPKWGGSREELEDFVKRSAHSGLPSDRLDSVAYKVRIEIAEDYWRRKQYGRAIEQYEGASKLCRLNEPWLEISQIQIEQANYSDALAAAESAMKMVPDSPQGRKLKARALHGLGRHAEAFELLVKLAPQGDPVVLTLLGEYYAAGQGGAKRDLEEARRLFMVAARSGNQRALWYLKKMDGDSQ